MEVKSKKKEKEKSDCHVFLEEKRGTKKRRKF